MPARLSFVIAAFVSVALLHAANADAVAAQDMTATGTFGDWQLLTDGANPHAFCFVTSSPKSSTPKGASRGTPRAYISAWPKDGIKGEVSFMVGFSIKPASAGSATIGDNTFVLFGSKDKAFVKDATQELKLVEAMKKGSEIRIEATSERGTVVSDTYSLAGISEALQKLQAECF